MKFYLYLQTTRRSGCHSASFPQYERKNEEEVAALGQQSGWRWRKDAEVWLPCEHYLYVDLVKK